MSIAATGPVPAWWSTPSASGEADPRDDVIGRHQDDGQPPSEAGWGEDGIGFSDFLDILNPLQHIPGVSTVYREITGDTIAEAPRAVGGMIWGGPFGLVAAVANSITEAETGRDIGGNAIALATGDPGDSVDPAISDPANGLMLADGAAAPMDPAGAAPNDAQVQLAALTAPPRTLDPFNASNPAISAALPGGTMPASVLPAGLVAAGQVASGGVAGALGGIQSFSGSAAGALDRLVARSGGPAPSVSTASLMRDTLPPSQGGAAAPPRQILPSSLGVGASPQPASPLPSSSSQVRLGVPSLARSDTAAEMLDPRTRAAAATLASQDGAPRAPDGNSVEGWMMDALTKYEAMRGGGL